MNPKSLLSKTTSVIATLLLAVGGSLISTPSANAVALSLTSGPTISISGSTATATPAVWVGYTLVAGEGWWQACGTSALAENNLNGAPQVFCDAIYTSQSVQTGMANSTTLNLTGPFYKFNGSVWSNLDLTGKFIRWFEAPYIQGSQAMPYAASATYSIGGGGIGTCVIGGVTQTGITSMASSATTLTTSNAYSYYFNGDNTLTNCMFPVSPGFGTIAFLNGTQIGNASYIATTGFGYGPTILTRTLAQLLAGSAFTGLTVVDGDVYTIRYYFGISQAPTANQSGYVSASMTLMPGTGGGSSNNNVTATVERSIPTPVFQAPILNSIAPKMSAGFSSNGGRLVLKDVKPADITSVMLNGKKVEVVASKSGAALRIPAGAGAGDLKFTMADGTVIDVPNAVKITVSQVDPKLVDLNNLPTFKAGSVAVPSTIKKALLKNKEVILDSANAKCVGYATSNTAAARATALSRASNVCGIITDMNENIEPLIKVLVNKVVAKKSPVKYQTW